MMFPEEGSSCMLIGELLLARDCLNWDKGDLYDHRFKLRFARLPLSMCILKRLSKNYRVGRSLLFYY